MSDLRATQARSAHLEAEGADRAAVHARSKRDRLVRQLRAEDPQRWTIGALAKAVGCSRTLIAKIVAQPFDPHVLPEGERECRCETPEPMGSKDATYPVEGWRRCVCRGLIPW